MSKFNAESALCLVFEDEEAGEASDDELSDEVEDDDDLLEDDSYEKIVDNHQINREIVGSSSITYGKLL